MSEKPEVKRRILFLKGTSQMRLILKVYTILIFILLISNTAFFYIGNKELTDNYFKAHLQIRQTMDMLLPTIIAVCIFALFLAFVIVLHFTHKIAGPVHKLKLMSTRLKKGDFSTKVSFRGNDELQELADILNDIFDGLGTRVSGVKNELDEILSRVGALSGKNPDRKINGDVETVLNKLKSLKEKTDLFRV